MVSKHRYSAAMECLCWPGIITIKGRAIVSLNCSNITRSHDSVVLWTFSAVPLNPQRRQNLSTNQKGRNTRRLKLLFLLLVSF